MTCYLISYILHVAYIVFSTHAQVSAPAHMHIFSQSCYHGACTNLHTRARTHAHTQAHKLTYKYTHFLICTNGL